MKLGPLLLFLALFVGPPLLSALGRWLRQQIAEAGGGRGLDETLPDPVRALEQAPPPRRPPLPQPSAPAPAAVTTAPARSSVTVPAPRRLLEGLGSPSDLRRSVVVATLLGPCRALDPH
jgi:hypothetical protein